MAAKPSTTPRWADVGGDIVVPPSGKQDVGWLAAEKPPAQYFNWLANLAWQWTEYLSDGDLEGDHTIDGNLDITGSLDAAGDVTTGGLYKRPGRWRKMNACAGQVIAGSPTSFTTNGTFVNSVASELLYALVGDEGEQITEVRLGISSVASAGGIQIDIVGITNGTPTTLGGASSTGIGAEILVVSPLGISVADNDTTHIARVTTTSTNNQQIRSLRYLTQVV